MTMADKLYARIRLQAGLMAARDLQQGDFSRFVDGKGNNVYKETDARQNIQAICAEAAVVKCYPITARLLAKWEAANSVASQTWESAAKVTSAMMPSLSSGITA